MSEKAKVPAIRFKGFTDLWEQRKLRDLCIIFTDGDWIESKDQSDSGVRLVQTGNVGIAEYLDKPNNRKWISEDTFARLNCEEVLPGDILISRLPEPAGRACIMPFLDVRMITAVDCTIARTASDYSNKFLIQYLSSQYYFNEVNAALAGGTRQRISRSNLARFYIPTPVKYEEQEAIGKYFKQLDNLITLHQHKLLKIKNLKKAMLEKMFPKNGSNVPEVRFTGFTDAWEQRKVKNLCEISTGKSNTQDRIEDGIYPFYVRSPIIERSNRYLYDEEAVLTVGDGVGTGKIYHYVNGKYDLHQRVYRMFDFNNEVSAKYFYHYFSNHFYDRVMTMTAKTSVDSVRYEMISEMVIGIPSGKEQVKIINYLDNLDNLITLHQRKYEKLQNIKKACLEKMFV